jgi:hypothetical protein
MYRDQLGLPVTSTSVALPNCPIEIVQAEDDDVGLIEVQLRVDSNAGTHSVVSLGSRLVFVA